MHDVTEAGAATERTAPAGRPARWEPALAAAVLVLLSAAQRPPRAFVYDAGRYWLGSNALFTGASVDEQGDLYLRGVLTPFVYALPALAEWLAPGSGRWLVAAENGLMIAVIGAVLLPAIARAAGGGSARGPLVTVVCAALTWLVLGRFAPYPLMDVPAALLFLIVLRLVAGRGRWWALVAAGVVAGAALNLRPAYLIALGAAGAGAAVLHRARALLLFGGVVLASLPQALFNLSRGAPPGPMPPGTPGLMGFQAGYASYTVRYDTIVDTTGAPQQFYCDPAMARLVAGDPVTSTGGLLRALARGLPESAGFLLRKVGAALAWSSQTPYSAGAAAERYDLAVPIVLITVVGGFGLALAARRPAARLVAGAGLAVGLSLMTSATETRFALPLVLLGVAGCGVAAGLPAARLRSWRLPAAVALVTVLVLGLAAWGLAHPLPAGPADAARCTTA